MATSCDTARYKRKLEILCQYAEAVIDPYQLPEEKWIDDVSLWPQVEFGQIYSYLINTPGQFTKEKLKAYKSLDAFNYYISGWVQTVFFCDLGSNCVLKANVKASQRLSNEPHKAWIGVERKSGNIIIGHCTCMAGCGEVCSHVAGILFKVEACIRLGITSTTCTSMPCIWNQAYSKKVEPSPAIDICFSNLNRKREQSEIRLEQHHHEKRIRSQSCAEKPVLDKQSKFSRLYELYPKSAVFTVLPGFTCITSIERHELEPNLPPPLFDLYDPAYKDISENELLDCVKDIFDQLKITQEEADYLEESTRKQSNTQTWHDHRKGRITASYFHDVLSYTWKDYPKSIVKSIMQYYKVSPNIPALKWGREHEDDARVAYIQHMKGVHHNLQVRHSGLMINPLYPYLGASPDGVVSCDCCETGLLEIKCPYKYRNESPISAGSLSDRSYCLKEDESGTVCLSHSHQYYDQVQGQLAICKSKYCDFVCWTTQGLHVERIFQDEDYLLRSLPILKKFFCEYLLPEILTQKILADSEPTCTVTNEVSTDVDVDDEIYCICQEGEYGSMVECDNPKCELKWFHFPCVGLKRPPRGDWYCPNCRSKN